MQHDTFFPLVYYGDLFPFVFANAIPSSCDGWQRCEIKMGQHTTQDKMREGTGNHEIAHFLFPQKKSRIFGKRCRHNFNINNLGLCSRVVKFCSVSAP
jgi:hypothetical protein